MQRRSTMGASSSGTPPPPPCATNSRGRRTLPCAGRACGGSRRRSAAGPSRTPSSTKLYKGTVSSQWWLDQQCDCCCWLDLCDCLKSSRTPARVKRKSCGRARTGPAAHVSVGVRSSAGGVCRQSIGPEGAAGATPAPSLTRRACALRAPGAREGPVDRAVRRREVTRGMKGRRAPARR